MLIPHLPPFQHAVRVYIDLISHIKRQTLMQVSSSSVNVIPWCDSFHAHLYGAEGSSFKQSQLLAFFKRRFMGVGKGKERACQLGWRCSALGRVLIPLSLPVICSLTLSFRISFQQSGGNKFEYAKKLKNWMARFKAACERPLCVP